MWPFKKHKEELPVVSRPVESEKTIDELAAPLATNSLPLHEIEILKKKIKEAIVKLPYQAQQNYFEMMDRIGHSIREL